jgi:O-antigen/teichoic acid export membrane protein
VAERKKPSAEMKVTGSFMRPKRLLSGLGWNAAGQLVVVGIPLGFTPFLLHRLGATEYGIFALVSTLRGLLSNLDGGLGPTGTRYFPVYVGRGERGASSSFLFTILTLTGIIVGAETVAMILFAPTVAKSFSLGSDLANQTPQFAQLIRELMPALFVAAIRTHLQRLLMAYHRWAFVNYTQVIAVVAYTVSVIFFSYRTPGLQCLIWGTYVQEGILLITVLWGCRPYVSLQHLRLMPISEIREILRFGWRVQIAAVASSFNYEVDALLVGFLFPVRDVAYYSIGANFGQQVLNMPANGLNPMATEIGRAFGRSGKEGVLRTFSDTQRMWVTVLGIFPIVAALEGWFGVRTWLGAGSQVAAISATLLVIGSAPLLFSAIVDVTAKAVGMPEIESWYLGVGMIVNVACTIPLALRIGVIGVPLGTAIGQVASFVVCIYLARRKIGKEITPFFRYIRYGPVVAATAVAAAVEFLFRNILPTGGIGFVLSGLLTLPAFFIYYGWVYRELLLRRLGSRVRRAEAEEEPKAEGGPRRKVGEDDGAYARRQLRGLQALLAIAEAATTGAAGMRAGAADTPDDDRQLRGLQVLIGLAEPEMAAVPFAGATVRLRYTGPLEKVFDGRRPLSRPTKAEKVLRE